MGHVMDFDYSVDLLGAAIANFYTVAIENFVKFMRGWKVFINEFEESFGNVGRYILTESWVEPHYVASTAAFTLGTIPVDV